MPAKSSIAIAPKRRTSRAADRALAAETPAIAPTSPLRQTRRAVLAQPSHRFPIGSRLHLAAGVHSVVRTTALCTVVSRLPYEGRGALQYRVRSDAEQFERIVSEADLTPS